MYKYSAIAAVFAAALVTAVPAHSQSIEIGPGGIEVNPDRGRPGRDRDRSYRRDEIGEREAARIARRQGMREVDDISRRRSSIVVRGEDRRGNDMRVVIDRRTGDVLDVD